MNLEQLEDTAREIGEHPAARAALSALHELAARTA